MYFSTLYLDLVQSLVFFPVCSQDSGGNWTTPSDWNGTVPVLYRSFDNMDGLVLMEATVQKNYAPLVSGQVNFNYR